MQAEVQRKPYREKTLVLCIYDHLVRERGSSRRVQDGLMIKVEFSDQIKGAFEAELRHRMQQISPRYQQHDVRLLSYVTSNGRQNF